MSRPTQSYASVPPFGTPIEELANGPALDEQRMREKGTAVLFDESGASFGVAHWWPGPRGERWYAQATSDRTVRTRGKTVAAVTRQLARKLETR